MGLNRKNIRLNTISQKQLCKRSTAVQIAVQELYAPVLIPAPERWFDLAIVVEESPSLAIWEDTIVELQELVECQGAFRQIRTWRLKGRQGKAPEIKLNWQPNHVNECSYKASALNDPTGRRIIWVVSDCTSVLWEQPQLYEILAQWGKFSPLTLIQLFPEQLWNSTALEMGHLVSIRSAYPGAAHARLTAEVIPLYTNLLSAASLQQPQKHLTLPIISLEPEPLNHWAKVTTGTANSSMIGIQINLEELIAESAEDSADTVALNPQERIDAFRANASITAQKLAGLMASVPVSLPIVHLIQKAMLPQSRQVHVAEVFMGGLMELVETAADNQKTVKELQFPSYRFIEEVREQLIETLPISKTLRVIDILSAHISEKLGLGTKSFTALIADPRLQPDQRQELQNFANIPLRTLKRLGGDYQELAEELEQNYDYLRNTSKSTSNSTRTLNEAKILLVGDVGVGKT